MYKVWVNRMPVIWVGNILLPAPVNYPDLVNKAELIQIIKSEKGKREVSFSVVKKINQC